MRIAINGLFLREPYSGTGQYLVRLLSSLAALESDEMIVIAPRGASLPHPLAGVSLRHYSDGQVLGANLAKVMFEQVIFPRACAALKVDAAHVPHWGSPLWPTVPTVVTVHDLIPMVLPAYRGSLAVRAYTRLASMSARRARIVMADSACSARDVVERLRVPADKVQVVYLAAGESYFPRTLEEQAAVRARLGLPDDFLLYLGGFDVRKNLGVLMAALNRVRLPGLHLVVAGELPPRDTVFFPQPQGLARAQGVAAQVKFIGRVLEDDKPALYSAARAFLYPSRYEGFGLPPLEAMACGTPVAVSSAGSLPEVVGDAGVTVHPDNLAGWADAVQSLWSDLALRETLRARGLAQSRRFSWDVCAHHVRRVYATAAGA